MSERRALIVRGGWEGHAPVEATELFLPFLREQGFEVRIEESPEVYADADALAATDLIVQSMTMSEISHDPLLESKSGESAVPLADVPEASPAGSGSGIPEAEEVSFDSSVPTADPASFTSGVALDDLPELAGLPPVGSSDSLDAAVPAADDGSGSSTSWAEVGLPPGTGLVEQPPQVCLHRGLRDAEHLGDVRHAAAGLDHRGQHPELCRAQPELPGHRLQRQQPAKLRLVHEHGRSRPGHPTGRAPRSGCERARAPAEALPELRERARMRRESPSEGVRNFILPRIPAARPRC